MIDQPSRPVSRTANLRRTLVKTVAAATLISALASTFVSTSAFAQSTKASGPDDDTLTPKRARGAVKPAVLPGFNGPLASFAEPLAERGVKFHVLALDFTQGNPSVGLQPGHASHSTYIIEGVDLDLTKLFGMPGTSLHYENIFFAGVSNLNLAPQIGDVNTGYPPPFTPRIAWLSRATVEQKALDGKLDVEIGATHPAYYFAAFQCSSINSCFQYMLYINAGYTSYGHAVPGGVMTYNATKTVYAEAGVFAVQPNANFHVGYDFPDERYDGVLGMAEIGMKTDFAIDPYPYKVSLTGFINTANHADLNAASATTGISHTQSGTSGVVFQGEKVVWRQDNGADAGNATPTALKLYGSAGTAIDSTIPIQADVYVGATLMSPFAGRPADRFGLKVDWLRLNPSYAQYINVAKTVAGGGTSPYNRDTFVFEANAHIQLPLGIAFEPVFDYTVHPTSFYNPTSAVKARDGVYLGSTVVVPLGVIFGLAAAS